jgi:hypothetical protein
MGTKSKKLTPWEEVTKNISPEELERIGGELQCTMAAVVREEIDRIILEDLAAVAKGLKPKPGRLSPMNIPKTKKWKEWSNNQKKMGDIGTKLLKYESKNQKTKR